MGSLSISIPRSSITQTSFKASVTTSGSVAMQHNWYLDGELYARIQNDAGEGTSSCFFSGLSPGTTYSVDVRVYTYNPWKILDSGSATVMTDQSGTDPPDEPDEPDEPEKPRRPDDWEWWSTGISEGLTLRLSANEWNAFIGRIQEFAKYKGVSLDPYTLSAAIAESKTTRMASQANAVRLLINQLSPRTSIPARVYRGNVITADFVNGLKDSLNSVS